jgi:hypothetical protein
MSELTFAAVSLKSEAKALAQELKELQEQCREFRQDVIELTFHVESKPKREQPALV